MTGTPPIPEELWSTIPPAAQAVLAVVFSELNGRVATLEARIKELEVRLGQNSSNSSKPPSSDPPHVKPTPPRKPSGRKKGGQPGHPKRPRPQLPPDRIVELKSDFCDGCGTALSGDDASPLVHQVIEIPPPKPEVVEYRQHRRCCPHCDRVSYPLLPDDARQGFGSRVQAIAALLSGRYRLGKRAIAQLLGDLFGVPSSTGAVCKLQHRTAAALEPVAREASAHLVGRPANVDETEWVEGQKKGWLWTVVTRWVTAFRITQIRTKVTFREVLPGRLGVLTTDRLSVYDHLDKNAHQVCWAHLRRDFQAMIDRKDEGSPIGEGLLGCADRLLEHWKRVRDGTLSRKAFQDGPLVELVSEVNGWLGRWESCTSKKTRNVCYELLQLGQPLWLFASTEGVEPTNNAAERALRHAVCWRKMSYRTDSARGSRFVERILTVVESCRQQGRNLLTFLVDAIHAARVGTEPPSLIPIVA